MKVLVLAAALTLSASLAQSKTFQLPNTQYPVVEVTIPDAWKPETFSGLVQGIHPSGHGLVVDFAWFYKSGSSVVDFFVNDAKRPEVNQTTVRITQDRNARNEQIHHIAYDFLKKGEVFHAEITIFSFSDLFSAYLVFRGRPDELAERRPDIDATIASIKPVTTRRAIPRQ